MNAKQKKFILNKLIPFILREEGRGFAMEFWKIKEEVGEKLWLDGVPRDVPVCGTAACIGGSAQCLLHPRAKYDMGYGKLAAELGLSLEQTHGLFYEWNVEDMDDSGAHWPKRFANQFKKAATPLGKAKVAVALLKEVVKTNGKCLEAKS